MTTQRQAKKLSPVGIPLFALVSCQNALSGCTLLSSVKWCKFLCEGSKAVARETHTHRFHTSAYPSNHAIKCWSVIVCLFESITKYVGCSPHPNLPLEKMFDGINKLLTSPLFYEYWSILSCTERLLKYSLSLCMVKRFFVHHSIALLFDRSHVYFWPLRATPPSSYLFSISAPLASPHLARPLPARHTIFGITPFCRAISQWHQLSPLPFQHPLLTAAQSWAIYPPSHWSFSQTSQAKGRRGCRDVSQPVKQPSSQLASQTQLLSCSQL